jgi:hypothetical protein
MVERRLYLMKEPRLVIVINPVVPTCLGCGTMMALDAECPGLCDDPPDLMGVDDDVDPVVRDKNTFKLTDEDRNVESCENCLHIRVSLGDEPCNGCFDCAKWEPQEAPEPAPDTSLHDTLYRQGCWSTLETRLHDLMSEWSCLAADCKHASSEAECNHPDSHLIDCDYDLCPRINE